MSGHSLERCWKLNGNPQGYKPNIWKRNVTSHAHVMHNEAVQEVHNCANEDAKINTQLTTSQYQKLMEIMAQEGLENDNQEATNINSTALVAPGTFCFVSHIA